MKKDRKIRRELLDELLAGYKTPEDLTGPEGILKQLTGALVERALEAELTDHLGYDEHAVEGRGSGNSGARMACHRLSRRCSILIGDGARPIPATLCEERGQAQDGDDSLGPGAPHACGCIPVGTCQKHRVTGR